MVCMARFQTGAANGGFLHAILLGERQARDDRDAGAREDEYG